MLYVLKTCFNRLPFSCLWSLYAKVFVLIDYMHVCLNFIWISFYFNRLHNILINYNGLRGSYSSIFNKLLLHFNRLHIVAFGFKVKMRANLIDCFVILINYLCVCCVQSVTFLHLHLIKTSITPAITPLTYHSQPEHYFPSIKANLKPHFSHTSNYL